MNIDNQRDNAEYKLQRGNVEASMSLSLLESVINKCGGSIYIVQNNRIVFHNPQFTALTGYSSDELIQKNFLELVHPKDKKLINLLFSNNYKEISQKTSRSYTFRAVNKNGEIRWFKSNVSLITWNGKPALLDNCFDITSQKEFEHKLVEEEQNFRLLVNGFEDMVFIISSRGSIIQVNRSVFNRLGFKEHQIILRSFASLFSTDQKETIRKSVSDSFFGKRMQISASLLKVSEHSIPVEIRLFKGNWSGKQVVFAICQDVSLRLEAERIIKLSEEKFSKAFNNNAVMMTISTLDDGRYIDVNHTFLEVIGLSREEVVGKTSRELKIFPEIKLRERLKEIVIKEGRATNIETSINPAKGPKVLCNFSTELIDIQGEPCLLAVLTDITERKKSEEKIRLSEQRFRQLAELLPEKVFEANPNGQITFANNYLLSYFGYSPKQLYDGMQIEHLFNKKSRRVISHYIKNSHKQIELPSVELVAKREDNTEFPVLTHIIAVKERGKVNRYMGIMVDISTRKQQELELVKAKELAEEASKAKEQFLSTMSHEIRTPMNGVIGLANILLQDNPMEHQKENLRALKFSAEGLMALLNDILDFNKIEAGKLKLNRRPISLKELANGVWNMHKHIITKKGLELNLSYDEAIPENLLGDFVRLNQILTNLISNAIKFTEKGKIVITLKLLKETKSSASVFFSVSDTGIGIPYDKQKFIFQEFTQANYQTTRKYGGSGLGLAICKKLIAMHKSEINLRSEAGKGSEFYFTICLRKSKSQKVFATDSSVPLSFPERNGIPYKVLVVEDNEINSYIAIKFLKKWGMETSLAENGAKALEMIEKNDFDIILMDLEMPVMNGYDATQTIRNLPHPTKSKTPIIALTASAMLDVQKKIFNLGMNDFVLKPFNPNNLKSKIANLLVPE
ncbi:MAG: PAS domain S-box protein [Bacteroidales bacterium]